MNSIVSQEGLHLSENSIPNLPTTKAIQPVATTRAARAEFKSEWHDAKEIVVPFDDSSFSGLLVSQKEFAAAYTSTRARPPAGGLHLDSGLKVGHIFNEPSVLERAGHVVVGLLSVLEKLMMIWTPALLLTALRQPGWWSMILAGVWITILWVLYRFGSRLTASLWAWTSGLLATLAWVYHADHLLAW